MSSSDRDYDVVVFGATGFVGKLTALYLAGAAPEGTRVALAGRSQTKLEAVRREMPGAAAEWQLVVADSSKPEDMKALAASTQVVATTVGPYYRYGMPLVEACADAGTDYADLTGETLFMRRSIDTCHERAARSGARIVHTCGFDSIPSDIGTMCVYLRAAETGAGDLGETTLVVRRMKGGASGGTIDSARGQIDAAKADKTLRKLIVDPYGLSPDRAAEPNLGPEGDPMKPVHDEKLGGWLAPFVMGTVNSRVVRRSNALQAYAYGRTMRYRELMATGSGPVGAAKAAAVTGGIAGLFGGLSFGPTRKLLDRVLPDPGEGPSEEAREKGFFNIEVHSDTAGGAHLVCTIEASGDPGYKATAVMLGESALAMALDRDALPDAAGVLTPSTAIGTALLERLRAAGHSYDVA